MTFTPFLKLALPALGQVLQDTLGERVPFWPPLEGEVEDWLERCFGALPQGVVLAGTGGQVLYLNAAVGHQQQGQVQDFSDLNLEGFSWHRIGLSPATGARTLHWGEPLNPDRNWQAMRLEQLFSAMTDVIIVFDRQGTHLEIAPTNPDLLFRPASDQLGKTMFEVFDPEFALFFTDKITRALDRQERVEFGYTLPLQGRETHFAASLTPLSTNTVMLIARDVTQQKHAEQKLQSSEKHLRKLLRRSPVAIALLDATGKVLQVNERFERTYGYTQETVPHINLWWSLAYPDPVYRQEVQRRWQEANEQALKASRPETVPDEYWITTRSGEVRITEVTAAYLGEVMMIVFNDITERKTAELERQERLAQMELLNTLSEALSEVGWDSMRSMHVLVEHLQQVLADTCLVHLLERGKLTLQAAEPSTQQTRKLFRQVQHFLQDSLDATPPVLKTAVRSTLPGEFLIRPLTHCHFLVVPLHIQGRSVGTVTLLRHQNPQPFTSQEQALVQTIADRVALLHRNAQLYTDNVQQAQKLREMNSVLERRIEARTEELQQANRLLQKQALEDALTGLANRRHFNGVLGNEVRRACRKGEHLSLLLCDVDFFKRYNDFYGHLQGDQALQEVAEVLKNTFQRASDCCARFGGEEFAVVLPHTGARQAKMLAEKLLQAVRSRQIEHQDSSVASHLTVSLGVVTAPVTREITPEMLVHLADHALYESKARGRNQSTCVVLDPQEEKGPKDR